MGLAQGRRDKRKQLENIFSGGENAKAEGIFFFKWNIKQEKFKLAYKIIEKIWKAIYQNITSRQSLSTKQREWRDLGEPTAWLFYFPLSLVALLKMPMVEPLEATQFH